MTARGCHLRGCNQPRRAFAPALSEAEGRDLVGPGKIPRLRSGQAWSLGPASGPSVVEGVDFCTLAPDGRLASVVGFIDKAPT